MKRARIIPTLAFALGGLVAPALGQDAPTSDEATTPAPVGSDGFADLSPPDLAVSPEAGVCPDRPPRPEWAEDLKASEVLRSLLLTRIYEARSYEVILETGDCSCANRAPSWDAADAEYQAEYAGLDLQAQDEAEDNFRRLRNSLEREARALCREQGNW